MNRHQQGYTLIELMISLLLGLMMISGFGSLFVQTQKSSTIQRSLSYMMEDGRYIVEAFGKELRRSGSLRSKMTTSGSANVVFTADASVLGSTMSFSAGDYIRGEYESAGFGAAEGGKDIDKPYNINRLVLRYQLNDNTELAANDPSSDNSPCTRNIHLESGEDPAINRNVVTLYFYVALDDSNIPVLYCKAKRQDLDNSLNNKPSSTATAEPLISNVQKLLITYGIDTDADGAANYYVGETAINSFTITDATITGATVTNTVISGGVITDGIITAGTSSGTVIGGRLSAGTSSGETTTGTTITGATITGATVSYWPQVVAAKLSLVLRSEDDNLTTSSVIYAVDGATGSPFTATDKRLYREFSTTIAFRNKI